ncbi:hypothetical protein Tco_1182810 [Tanacetum coccineum]
MSSRCSLISLLSIFSLFFLHQSFQTRKDLQICSLYSNRCDEVFAPTLVHILTFPSLHASIVLETDESINHCRSCPDVDRCEFVLNIRVFELGIVKQVFRSLSSMSKRLLHSCSSDRALDKGTYIIRLPLKLVLRGNLILCGVCICLVVLCRYIGEYEVIMSSRSETSFILFLKRSSEECSGFQLRIKRLDVVWTLMNQNPCGFSNFESSFVRRRLSRPKTRNSSSVVSGVQQRETHVLFQSLIQSGLLAWAQGLVQPEPHVFFQGLTPAWETRSASVSLFVRSKSVVDEDSWTTFSDVSSSELERGLSCRKSMRDEILVLRLLMPYLAHYFRVSLGVVSDTWIPHQQLTFSPFLVHTKLILFGQFLRSGSSPSIEEQVLMELHSSSSISWICSGYTPAVIYKINHPVTSRREINKGNKNGRENNVREEGDIGTLHAWTDLR